MTSTPASHNPLRAMLYSLYSAKRDETRAKRVADALAVLEGDPSSR